MEKTASRIPWFGVALILFGALLLVSKLNFVRISFHQVFWPVVMLLSLVGVGRGFAQGRRGKIFFGTVVFLYSVFFLLHSIDQLDIGGHLIIASTFVIFGAAFFMLWCNDFRDWFHLVPAILLGGVGAAFLGSELGYFSHWEVLDVVRLYWPLGLILFGAGMILRKRMHAPDQSPPAAS